jgi:guanine deaminase
LEALSDETLAYHGDALALFHREGPEAGRIVYFGAVEGAVAEWGEAVREIPVKAGLHLPPFYDMHFHWVQDDVREMPKTSLIEWLNRYTFPEEARYADADFARRKAESFWRRILRLGTVGGLCYSSIHRSALDAAMACACGHFKIGNVTMTMNCPDPLLQSVDEAIAGVREAAGAYGHRYVCSPRFAPTTAPEVMRASAATAAEARCFQQTHLDETRAEIDWVLDIYRQRPGFEDIGTYLEIYDRCGMLGPQTVFGHCLHLEESEWLRLAETDSVIASCPSSNAPIGALGLGSGLFDWRRAEAFGLRWTLASDIGGGPFLSMFDVMHSFVTQNRERGSDPGYCRALYRSTRAGAAVLGLGKRKGRFAKGQDFDCIRVKASAETLAQGEPAEILEAIITGVGERADYSELVVETILEGKTVGQ